MWCFNRKKKKVVKPNIIWLDETDSTNNYLKNYIPASDEKICVVVADYQEAGRGQGDNTWESERGQNLLFSIVVHPLMVPVHSQFLLSMAEGLALKEALDKYTEAITLKWPNDVYWKDKKIGGTLIENTLGGGHIKNCIFGTGIDVNQTEFKSSAPNPISLKNILGSDVDRKKLMDEIIESFTKYYAMIENGQYGEIINKVVRYEIGKIAEREVIAEINVQQERTTDDCCIFDDTHIAAMVSGYQGDFSLLMFPVFILVTGYRYFA